MVNTKMYNILEKSINNYPPTDKEIMLAEYDLGYKLPGDYKNLLKIQNGGYLIKKYFDITFQDIGVKDVIEVESLWGVKTLYDENGINGNMGSNYMIKEWEYPNIGIVLFYTVANGHDIIMLDYSLCGAQGEPSVVYVSENRNIYTLSYSFLEFVNSLHTELNLDVATSKGKLTS